MKLYTVASLYYSDSQETNERLNVEEIVEVRLATMEALARTLNTAALFISNVTHAVRELFQSILDNYDARQIESGVFNVLDEGGVNIMSTYDAVRIIALIKRLSDEDIHLHLCQTEEVFDAHCDRIVEEMVNKCIAKVQREDAAIEVPSELLVSLRSLATLDVRDRGIVRNIESHGQDENILFIGTDHKLTTLDDSVVIQESYRLDVSVNEEHVIISGKLPERFVDTMIACVPQVTASGMPVLSLVTYV